MFPICLLLSCVPYYLIFSHSIVLRTHYQVPHSQSYCLFSMLIGSNQIIVTIKYFLQKLFKLLKTPPLCIHDYGTYHLGMSNAHYFVLYFYIYLSFLVCTKSQKHKRQIGRQKGKKVGRQVDKKDCQTNIIVLYIYIQIEIFII